LSLWRIDNALKNDNTMITEVKILQQIYRLTRKILNQHFWAKLNLNARHSSALPQSKLCRKNPGIN